MIAEPLVEVRCVACGGESYDMICAAREVEAHLEYLRRFHRRRLRAGAPRSALEERAEFTQRPGNRRTLAPWLDVYSIRTERGPAGGPRSVQRGDAPASTGFTAR